MKKCYAESNPQTDIYGLGINLLLIFYASYCILLNFKILKFNYLKKS